MEVIFNLHALYKVYIPCSEFVHIPSVWQGSKISIVVMKYEIQDKRI